MSEMSKYRKQGHSYTWDAQHNTTSIGRTASQTPQAASEGEAQQKEISRNPDVSDIPIKVCKNSVMWLPLALFSVNTAPGHACCRAFLIHAQCRLWYPVSSTTLTGLTVEVLIISPTSALTPSVLRGHQVCVGPRLRACNIMNTSKPCHIFYIKQIHITQSIFILNHFHLDHKLYAIQLLNIMLGDYRFCLSYKSLIFISIQSFQLPPSACCCSLNGCYEG